MKSTVQTGTTAAIRDLRPATGSSGFTLIEILVVMALFALIAGFGLLVSMETYQGSNYASDRSLLVAALQRARSQAINNICYGTCTDGAAHGVHIDTANNMYVIFQGNAYNAADPENARFEAAPATTRTGSSDVVFAQLSGATAGASITLSSGGRSSVITVSPEGQITWTN